MSDKDKPWEPAEAKHLEPKLPLFREMPPAKPYPLSALGGLLQSTAMTMKEAIQAPDALYGQSLLGAASLAVQGHADVFIDGRTFPISLYLLSIGVSGERKSSVDRVALVPHLKIEKLRMAVYEEKMQRYVNRHQAWEEARRQALSKRSRKGDPTLTVEQCENKLQAVGPKPQKPLTQMLLIDEPTFEGLQKMLLEGQPSVGLFSDEGGRMFGGHAMNSDNQLKTISGFSKFWDGSAVPRVRSGDGATKIYGKRLSLHLMIQPGIAAQVTNNPVLIDQGFLSRCLIAHPESTVGSRLYKDIDISEAPEIVRYIETMTKLLNVEMPMLKDKTNELNPRQIMLASNAKNLWVLFHNCVEEQMADGGHYANIRGFASKAAENALRIAAVLALIETPDAPEISSSQIESGIELADFYLSEAVRIHEAAILNPDLYLAQKLSGWCQRYDVVHPTFIYQYGPNAIRDKAIAQKLIKILEEHAHLKRIPDGKKIDGKWRSDAWEVVK
ncbi:MAG: YfjI family protein [Bdellovibrionales bacterium]